MAPPCTSTSRAPRRSWPSAGRACASWTPASRAAEELGSGASLWLRVNGGGAGVSGEQAEPALRAMLERLYEDATSFGFPEERFERVYLEVEAHPLPRRARGAGRGAAARRGDRGLADRPRRRAGIGARRGRRRAARGGLPGERRRRAGRAVRARTRRDGRRRHHGERGRGSLHAPGQRPAPLGAGPDRTGRARLAQHRRRTLAAAAVRWRRGRAGGRLVPAER